VRAFAVVVLDVDPQDVRKMVAADDQKPVEALILDIVPCSTRLVCAAGSKGTSVSEWRQEGADEARKHLLSLAALVLASVFVLLGENEQARATYPGANNSRIAFGMSVGGNVVIYSALPNGNDLRRLTDSPSFDICARRVHKYDRCKSGGSSRRPSLCIPRDALRAATDELTAAGPQALGIPCDVSYEDQVAAPWGAQIRPPAQTPRFAAGS
jgi:hypothetical protein